MPRSWTEKDERMYEHVKESSREQGKPQKRAKEIAARTVNKHRREQSRTPQKTTQGSGNPNTRLEDRSRDELYNVAQKENIAGRSKMTKQQLIDAIRDRR